MPDREVIWLGMWTHYAEREFGGSSPEQYARACEVEGKQYIVVFENQWTIDIDDGMQAWKIDLGYVESMVEMLFDLGEEEAWVGSHTFVRTHRIEGSVNFTYHVVPFENYSSDEHDDIAAEERRNRIIRDWKF